MLGDEAKRTVSLITKEHTVWCCVDLSFWCLVYPCASLKDLSSMLYNSMSVCVDGSLKSETRAQCVYVDRRFYMSTPCQRFPTSGGTRRINGLSLTSMAPRNGTQNYRHQNRGQIGNKLNNKTPYFPHIPASSAQLLFSGTLCAGCENERESFQS